MNSAIVNIKVNPKVKRDAQQIAQEMGISLSGLINGYLRQLVRTREATFSLSDVKDAIAWLNNPKKKYANQLR